MTATQCALADPRDKERRYREMLRDLEPFNHWLREILTIAPPRYIFYKDTKELISEFPPEWQQKIDYIIEEKRKHIKHYYPEFYNEKQVEP